MNIYFDNAATTKASAEVLEAFVSVAENNYANAASLHMPGLEAERQIKIAKHSIGTVLGSSGDDITFTSGGTESNNLAILGTALSGTRRRIITTKTEHPSVLEPIETLKIKGAEIIYTPIDEHGVIDLEAFRQNLSVPAFVSISHVSSETGTIQPIEEIGRIISQTCQKTIFHSDGVQAFGKIKVSPQKCNIHLYSVSAHKIHGLKSIGALYVKRGVHVNPILFGGGQQKNLRPGTENNQLAASFQTATTTATNSLNANYQHALGLKKLIWEGISKSIPDAFLNGQPIETASPYILNISFLGIRGEVLLHALEDAGIFVSTGSACSSKEAESKTLTAMGLGQARAASAIRLSFSKHNTQHEAQHFITILRDIVPKLRLFAKG